MGGITTAGGAIGGSGGDGGGTTACTRIVPRESGGNDIGIGTGSGLPGAGVLPPATLSGGSGGKTGGFGAGGAGGLNLCSRVSTDSLAASSCRNLMRTPGRRNGPPGVAHASTTSHVPRSAWVPSASRITNGLWLPGDRVVRLATNSVRFSQYRANVSTN